MKKISSEDAFMMFNLWRDRKSQLQLSIWKGEVSASAGTPAQVISSGNEKVEVSIIANGQEATWRIDFSGASFEIGKPEDAAVFPKFAERAWVRYLLVELPDNGNKYLFAEKSVDTQDAPVR
jgi:hypothetical protein